MSISVPSLSESSDFFAQEGVDGGFDGAQVLGGLGLGELELLLVRLVDGSLESVDFRVAPTGVVLCDVSAFVEKLFVDILPDL